MRKVIILFFVFVYQFSFAQLDSAKMFRDSLEAKLKIKTGSISLGDSIGTLKVPEGFGYLNSNQTEFVLKDLWGNEDGSGTLGMLVPADKSMLDGDSWAFIITFEGMGYVKDDDADDIDYDDMLKELKEDISKENEERVKSGQDKVELIGWASKPFYDSDKKVLHWAKEIKFGDRESNTLNYNVRVLGRKGVLMLNAVSSMDRLADVKKNIDPVLSSFTYAQGQKYSDFNPGVDEVAAWTIGGLVAGKLLAKVGFFAIFLKYIKLIVIAIGAAGAGIWKWFKKKTEPPVVKDMNA